MLVEVKSTKKVKEHRVMFERQVRSQMEWAGCQDAPPAQTTAAGCLLAAHQMPRPQTVAGQRSNRSGIQSKHLLATC